MENRLSFTGTRRAGALVVGYVPALLVLFLAPPASADNVDCAKLSTLAELRTCIDATAVKRNESLVLPVAQANTGASKITITKGAQFSLCKEYARGLREHDAPDRYCGVPLPSGNQDFRVPVWEEIDPADNMALVRDIFYWANAGIGLLGTKNFERQLAADDILPDILDQAWETARPEVERMVAAGEIQLQRSLFDINFDGDAEPIYRMTPLVRAHSRRTESDGSITIKYWPVKIQDTRCTPVGTPSGNKQFMYHVRPEDSRSSHLVLWRFFRVNSGFRFFYWRDRIYWLTDIGHILEPVPATGQGDQGSFFPIWVCGFEHANR